tara:strand:+ start:2978 stop:3853 length:876 start_codon:yes stop_codon:yes gene_type:complete
MTVFPILSICIAVFNREKELSKLLKSIDYFDKVELVIVNDGSTDDIYETILSNKKKINIKYFETLNRGRSSALSDAIKHSSGKYAMIMDSDDYFLSGGIKAIITQIEKNSNINCFVFGTKFVKNNKEKEHVLPDGFTTNLIKLRADFKVRGDLKEIVNSNLLKKCIYEKSYQYRFTPTSLMWQRVSRHAKCYTNDTCVAVKTYNKKGISASITQIKFENAEPYCDLFYEHLNSNLYDSKIFRLKAKIQFYRYSFLTNRKLNIHFKDIFFVLFGFILNKVDNFRFSEKKRAH